MTGNEAYYLWLGILVILMVIGGYSWATQINQGLEVTNLSNQVSWGAYIANFSYLVGVLAVAVLIVVPSFILKDQGFKDVVLIAHLLAFSTIIMALLFIAVDLGRPERFLHIMPVIGRMHFPGSILAWDVVVLNGYFILNMFIPFYLLFKIYMNEQPNVKIYNSFNLTLLVWAISIHTVSAFLYAGLGGRPHWNSAVLAPRFIISAFANGPAILVIVFKIIERYTEFKIRPDVYKKIISFMVVMLVTNMFLFGSEMFKEFYTDSVHVASMQYLMFGLHGKGMLIPYIWGAIFMELAAALILIIPSTRKNWTLVLIACVFIIFGIWIEKGMGLIVPGFLPTPLGNLVEYTPSSAEIIISVGIWALGALIFTVLAKVCIAIQLGKVRYGA